MKILFVTTEEAPFAKEGGLGEVMFSLPRALARLGHDARVMIPRYGTIDLTAHKISLEYEGLEVPTAPAGEKGKRLRCNVRKFAATSDPRSPVTTYFLENQEYYELRSNIYGYIDDRIRFALLSRGALEFLNLYREWIPEIIVSADWMTGFLPNFLKIDYPDYNRLKNLATVFSIHNLSSQGPLEHYRFTPEMLRDDGQGAIPDFFGERMQYINSMRRGIMYADLINTVSPTYANEIMTEEFGEGLEALLRERRDRLYGILNGLDYETTDPSRDPLVPVKFSARSLEKRAENKLALQKRFGLTPGEKFFVMGIVSRLWKQKGFDILMPIVETFLKSTLSQLVVLGTGDTEIMDFFHDLAEKFPERVGAHLQFDSTLPHLIYSGCDITLIPSRFEPSGLIQMEAMRFGAVPIARKVGGLADTVEDYSPEEDKGTGFLFEEPTPTALLIALTRAFTNWRHRDAWMRLQRRVMEKDFSWEKSAREYAGLFEKAIKIHEEDLKKTKSS